MIPSRGSTSRWEVSPEGRQFREESNPRLGDSAARQVAIDLAGDVAFQDPDDVSLGPSLLHPAFEVGPGFRVVSDADHDDAPQRAVGLAVPTFVVAEMSGAPSGIGGHRGHATHVGPGSSEWSRSGLSPAATRSVAAVSGPTPNRASRSGAVAMSSDSIFSSNSATSASRDWTRWASEESDALVAAVNGSADRVGE